MYELEFLPTWYQKMRCRRRRVALHASLSIALAITLGMWMFLTVRNIRSSEITLGDLRGQLVQTDEQLEEMHKLSGELNHWRRQDQLLSTLGYQVEVARLLRTLDTVMPREMSLITLQCDTEERLPTSPGAAVSAMADQGCDRHLRIRLHGAAPTDVDLTNFTTQLSALPYFENIAVAYVRDSASNGHAIREFEVTFSVNLNIPAGS